MGPDLVEEDWRIIAHYYVAVVGGGENGIDELEANEVGAHLWLLVDTLFAEVGGVAIGGDGEGSEVLDEINNQAWGGCGDGGEHTYSSESEPFCLQTTPRICAVASFLMTSRTVVSAMVTLHSCQFEFPPLAIVSGTEFTHFGVFLAASLSFIMNFP